MPGVGLATDVIVGFPGETEAQFEATYRLLEELRFDVVHVAAYSPRPGTPAERLADDVPPEEKERRRKAVDQLQERIAGEINARLLGQTVEILVETRRRGKWQGRTRTNKLVFFPVGEEDRTGRLVQVRDHLDRAVEHAGGGRVAMKRLIINADDFGHDEGVVRGIIDCHRAGAISSTSCMTNMPAWPQAAAYLKDHPELGAGVHLVFNAGQPVLPVAQVRRVGRPRRALSQRRADPAEL